MTVNPVRNAEGTPVKVPADNSRDEIGDLLLKTGRRSDYPLRKFVSNGVKQVKSAAAVRSPRDSCRRTPCGVTLIEVMVVIVIIAVAVIGAMGYRYYCALDARKADVQITAARVALLLLEGWNGVRGGSDYDPEAQFGLKLEIYDDAPGPGVPGGFDELDSYHIVANRVNYYATLSYKDTTDGPRVLNVSIAWLHDYQEWTDSDTYQSVKLTTYARY